MFDQKLSIKGSQALVLSKQMQQSLKILQMTSLQLSQHIANEAEINPFFEIEHNSADTSTKKDDRENEDNTNFWQKESYLRYDVVKSHEYNDNLENVQCYEKSLKEHLIEQINLTFKDNKDRVIASCITDSLDENGYLIEDVDHIAAFLKAPKKEVRRILTHLKKLEPVGLYAENLKDCLLSQALEKYGATHNVVTLINNLELVAKGEFNKLTKILKVDISEVKSLIKIIQTLDPKPGRNFANEYIRPKIVDVMIVKDDKGVFYAKLNLDVLPQIFINSKYFSQVSNFTKNNSEKKFCVEQYQNANWLLKSICQRSETILKITNQIAIEQRDFFEYGLEYLKPMTLADIAKKIGMHESTISRVSNKFVATPVGTYELKYFFSNSLSSNISENLISTKTVQKKLKELIEAETKGNYTLSDDELAEQLKEAGINISRRTIAKYRNILRIPASHIRKKNLDKFLND